MIQSKIRWVLWIFITFVLYVFSDSYLLFFLFVSSIAVPLIFLLCLHIVKNNIYYDFVLPEATGKGKGITCTIEIKNTGILPLFKARCFLSLHNRFTNETTYNDFYFSINGKQKESIDIQLKSRHCGNLSLLAEKAVYYDFFGIFHITQDIGVRASCLVLPDTFPVEIDCGRGGAEDMESIAYSATEKGYDASEIFEIREYMPGDAIKNIHWKLTSKFDELFIKEASLPIQNSILLFLDTSVSPIQKVEQPKVADGMLEAFVSISQAMANVHLDHFVGWYDYHEDRISLHEIPILNELSGLMGGILGIERQQDASSGLYRYFLLEDKNPFAHIVYITARNVQDEIKQMASNCKITVLQCVSEEEEKIVSDFGIGFSPQNPQEDLQQLII